MTGKDSGFRAFIRNWPSALSAHGSGAQWPRDGQAGWGLGSCGSWKHVSPGTRLQDAETGKTAERAPSARLRPAPPSALSWGDLRLRDWRGRGIWEGQLSCMQSRNLFFQSRSPQRSKHPLMCTDPRRGSQPQYRAPPSGAGGSAEKLAGAPPGHTKARPHPAPARDRRGDPFPEIQGGLSLLAHPRSAELGAFFPPAQAHRPPLFSMIFRNGDPPRGFCKEDPRSSSRARLGPTPPS